MNIEKIRKALNDAEKHFIGYGRAAVAKQMEEALAELDKAPKVLTAHDALSIAIEYGYEMGHIRYARDNGYLAPSAGLTVEEAEQIAVDARIEIDEIAWKSPPISYEKEFRSILKRRLTAAIEAKTNSK